jgi:hypothetical protein
MAPADGYQPGRRKVLIAGALLVPTIVTLHATPAWALTDYTMSAYRYGDNAGLCKNPDFDENAEEEDPNAQEFVQCRRERKPGQHYDLEPIDDNPGLDDDSPFTGIGQN